MSYHLKWDFANLGGIFSKSVPPESKVFRNRWYHVSNGKKFFKQVVIQFNE